jgi:hypothetical protein
VLLSISGNNASRVFYINSGVAATLDGITIRNGLAYISSDDGGGGIYSLGTLTVINSTISGNNAAGRFGGGIDNRGALMVINSKILGNIASDQPGGGIWNYGTVSVINSVISGNTASITVAFQAATER